MFSNSVLVVRFAPGESNEVIDFNSVEILIENERCKSW